MNITCKNWNLRTLQYIFIFFFSKKHHFGNIIACALGCIVRWEGRWNPTFYLYRLWFSWYILKLEHRNTLWKASLIAIIGFWYCHFSHISGANIITRLVNSRESDKYASLRISQLPVILLSIIAFCISSDCSLTQGS